VQHARLGRPSDTLCVHKDIIWDSIRKPNRVAANNGVSMDQLTSTQSGLIPLMSGFLTSRRIWDATTFSDHVNDFVYVHLMHDFIVNDTMLAVLVVSKILAQAEPSVRVDRIKYVMGFLGRVLLVFFKV